MPKTINDVLKEFDEKLFFNDLLLDYYDWSVSNGSINLSASDQRKEAERIANHITNSKKKIKSFLTQALQDNTQQIKEEIRKKLPERVSCLDERTSDLKWKGYNKCLEEITNLINNI